MADLTITVKGADEIVAKLQAFGVDMATGLEAICTAGAKVVESEIETQAPGSIGQAIELETKAKNIKRVTVVTGPNKKKWYARFVEHGTRPHKISPKDAKALEVDVGLFRASANHPGTAARPFMRPAFDGSAGEAQAAMAKEVEKVVDRV